MGNKSNKALKQRKEDTKPPEIPKVHFCVTGKGAGAFVKQLETFGEMIEGIFWFYQRGYGLGDSLADRATSNRVTINKDKYMCIVNDYNDLGATITCTRITCHEVFYVIVDPYDVSLEKAVKEIKLLLHGLEYYKSFEQEEAVAYILIPEKHEQFLEKIQEQVMDLNLEAEHLHMKRVLSMPSEWLEIKGVLLMPKDPQGISDLILNHCEPFITSQ
mmetsp:Transcript_29313/g.32562  ORF Transcript_29313/g.32562 Transcript_29313/m.32562 type:complete len:216 (-) Transcript_29313:55-702(-)